MAQWKEKMIRCTTVLMNEYSLCVTLNDRHHW